MEYEQPINQSSAIGRAQDLAQSCLLLKIRSQRRVGQAKPGVKRSQAFSPGCPTSHSTPRPLQFNCHTQQRKQLNTKSEDSEQIFSAREDHTAHARVKLEPLC